MYFRLISENIAVQLEGEEVWKISWNQHTIYAFPTHFRHLPDTFFNPQSLTGRLQKEYLNLLKRKVKGNSSIPTTNNTIALYMSQLF